MIVQAKCMSRAWDSEAAMLFYPGEIYEIERDSKLASLKSGKNYVFQFDRNAAPGETKDYTCDQCGKKCKTLNELGTHVRSEHNESNETPEEEEDPLSDRTCSLCKKVCRSPYGLKVHQRKAHAETVAVPA